MVEKKKSIKKPMAVMMSARANVFYLQFAKVCKDGDRVVYWLRDGDIDRMFNIPEKNTAFIMLGKGTSITDAAARKLAESGVCVGFCGTGGSPLFSSVSPVFLEPQSEYRPTEYMQKWAKMWFDENKRLSAAKNLLRERIKLTLLTWPKIVPDVLIDPKIIERLEKRITESVDTNNLLLSEAEWVKGAYALLAKKYDINNFKRDRSASTDTNLIDTINSMLTHGNYIAYGYAACALNTLGISFAFPLLHGKTRRGALVFDAADLFKDAIVLPLAFKCGLKGCSEQEFRCQLVELCWDNGILDKLFETLKTICDKNS